MGSHGIPRCQKCRKNSKAKRQTYQSFEVENTSLQIGHHHNQSPTNRRPPTGNRKALSDLEQHLQARLFRHKKATIEEACHKFDADGTGFLSRDQFASLLGSLVLHPGAEDFSILWQQYDPQQLGYISHSSWLNRFIASVSLPDGVSPPAVIAQNMGSTIHHNGIFDRPGTRHSRNSCGTRNSMNDSHTSRTASKSAVCANNRPGSSTSHFSIDCTAVPLSVR